MKLSAVIFLLIGTNQLNGNPKATSLDIDPNLVTAAGFSAGSYNSHYLHLVMSSLIKGSGLMSGSIYSSSYGQKIVETGKTEKELNELKDKAVKTAKEKLTKRESEGKVDPLSNLKGAPVFIWSGKKDMSMPPINQMCQFDLVTSFGAKPKYVLNENQAHNMAQDTPAEAIRYIYGNLQNSGISETDDLKAKDMKWKDQGTLSDFDQTPFIKSALEEYAKVPGGDAKVEHKLADTGQLYVPNHCKDGANKCKFMIVSHGMGGKASIFANMFGPFGSAYNIVMVFPQVNGGWDDSEYTGPLYDTNNGIQPIFFKHIINFFTEKNKGDRQSSSEKTGNQDQNKSPNDKKPSGDADKKPSGDADKKPSGDANKKPPGPPGDANKKPPGPPGDANKKPSGPPGDANKKPPIQDIKKDGSEGSSCLEIDAKTGERKTCNDGLCCGKSTSGSITHALCEKKDTKSYNRNGRDWTFECYQSAYKVMISLGSAIIAVSSFVI